MNKLARNTEFKIANIKILKEFHSSKCIKRIKNYITSKFNFVAIKGFTGIPKRQNKEKKEESENKKIKKNFIFNVSNLETEKDLKVSSQKKYNSPMSLQFPRNEERKELNDISQYHETKELTQEIEESQLKKKGEIIDNIKKSPNRIPHKSLKKPSLFQTKNLCNIKSLSAIKDELLSLNQIEKFNSEIKGQSKNKEKIIKLDNEKSQNSVFIIDNGSKERNKKKNGDDSMAKSYETQRDIPIANSIIEKESNKTLSQDKDEEQLGESFNKKSKEKMDNPIINIGSRRNNHFNSINAIQNEPKRKIHHKKSGSFIGIRRSNLNKESFDDFQMKNTTYRSRTHNIKNFYNKLKNNIFINDYLNNDLNNHLLNKNYEFQTEVCIEIKNHEKIFYLTKNITDFYNQFISICKDGILIDQKRYPLLKRPKISVIIPLYNAKKYLHYSLRSVQNQRMKEIEIILIDDCSKDDTLLSVNEYMKEDPRIRLIKNNVNRKILYSKSIGALNANGKYIMQLDQDDLFIRDDLFDILYNEAENNDLDLVQIKDITTNDLHIANKTRVNCHRRYQIHIGNSFEPMNTHYETNEQLKEKLYIDGNVFTLWGLLIKTNVYKKAIYYLWPVILNYKFTYYEDYLMTTIIIAFSKQYKFLNNFGLAHIKHKNSAMIVYSEYLFKYLLIFENVLNKYYIKYDHPKDINIILHLLQKYCGAYKDYYEKCPNLFKESILEILSNEYITDNVANSIREELGIKTEDFNNWNSYHYLMNSDEFLKLSNFQNTIINNTRIICNVNKIIISIIIYCIEFRYLENTINSIQNQNFKEFEIIIIYDNDDLSNLNLIQEYIKLHKNIRLINNQKKRGILFSYANAILESIGDFILLLKQGETLSKDNILNTFYEEIRKDNFDILEFNLLINKANTISNNSLSLYRCTHFESYTNFEFIKYDKNHINLDQEKDILTNKLIKSSLFKKIINEYNIINNEEIIYNYSNEIFLFLLSKEKCIFKRINEYGIIHYNNINKNIFYNLINNNYQKINDAIFYINFLFEYTSNSFDDKKTAINELFYLLALISNKFIKQNNKSIRLIDKFIKCNYIRREDKNYLQFYYNSLIN